MDGDKPIGTYQCGACKEIWDGSETYFDPKYTSQRLTCGDLFCGANVRRISELPKIEYEKALEGRVKNSK